MTTMDANAGLVDTIVAATGYNKSIVSVLIGLSLPLRETLISFLQSIRALLIGEKAKLIGKIQVADILANKLGVVVNAGRAALAPYDKVLNALPLKEMINSSQEFGEQFTNLFNSIPVEVPVNPATQLAGLDGFDAFAGINSYHSLRAKLDELAFRMERALTVSDKANKQSYEIDKQLDTIDMYLNILSRSQ